MNKLARVVPWCKALWRLAPVKGLGRCYRCTLGVCISTAAMSAAALSPEGVERWQQDLAFYRAELQKKHIDLFHQIDKADFDEYLNKLQSSLPVLTEEQVWVELMRLTQRVGDGHTSMPLWQQQTQHLPFEVAFFQGKAYVTAAPTEYDALLGSELLTINGELVSTVAKAVAELVPFRENAYSSNVRTAQYLLNAQVLIGLGVIAGGSDIPLSFQTDEKKVYLKTRAFTSPKLPARLELRSSKTIKVIEKQSPDLWFGSHDNGGTMYVKFRRYPTMAAMDEFAQDLLKAINKHQSKNLVIDLRDNYGGNFFVGLKLAERLVLADSIDWKAGVYTLTNNQTFSAAMSNAAQFQQILNAKLVGQATGAKPSGYQDMGQFSLPNSNIVITYSKRLYRFQRKRADAVFPDITIAFTIGDLREGSDKTLEWVWLDIASRQKLRSR